MKKEEIRKEFFKLKIKNHSYNQCRKILITKYDYGVTVRTLQRWSRRLAGSEWDLIDSSRRPKTIYKKINSNIESKVIRLRRETGWGEHKISDYLPEISHATIYRILKKHKLCTPNPRSKKRIKYVRWQRKHPNSLWQIDHSDKKIKDKWLISVLDDCSRYSLALAPVNRVTTAIVTRLLDELIKKHGKPREILSDNGSAYGLKSKHSKFDRWCNKRGIRHIRSAIHSPTTCGKVERLFQTFKAELPFCKCPEHFRMRYNHLRPHTSLHRKTPASVYFRG
jgi:transposase InsO family protein